MTLQDTKEIIQIVLLCMTPFLVAFGMYAIYKILCSLDDIDKPTYTPSPRIEEMKHILKEMEEKFYNHGKNNHYDA
jgi:hypothetical protein